MKYQIKRGNDQTILTVKPIKGELQRAIMGAHVVNMEFRLSEKVELLLGDYVDVYGNRYYINNQPSIAKTSPTEYLYSCEFKAVSYELGKTLYQSYDGSNAIKERYFSLMADASTFIDLLVKNANRNDEGGVWKKGVVDATIEKNFTFSGETCLQVLARLADEYELEWWVDSDRTIHLTKREFASGHQLEYGRGNGLYTITRETNQKDIVTRLFVDGSEKNLPHDYRGFKTRLQLPDGTPYLERNVNLYGPIELPLTFEIKPEYIGTITNYTDHLTVGDFNIDFNVNDCLIQDVKVKLVVLTGQLAGYSFEIEYFDWATKTFKLLVNQDEKALELPSPSMKLEVGDKYTFEGLKMPQSYITNAENRLLAKATEYINKNSDLQLKYTVVADPLHFKQNNIHIEVGNTVIIKDDSLNVNKPIRVVSVTRSLLDWFDYSIELSDQKVELPEIVRTYAKIEMADKVIKRYDFANPAKARMLWRSAEELRTMIFDPEGFYYTEPIRPLSIETQMLSVGSRSQQFVLNCLLDPNYLSNPNHFVANTGTLTHYTIAFPQIKDWVLQAYSNSNLQANSAYYIYAKCSKTTNIGQIILSTQAIKVDEDPNDYYFTVGVLHSVFEGVRGISLTYGQTTINGKFVTTGTIISQDGQTYFDLDNGEIGGRIIFKSGSIGNGVDGVGNKIWTGQPVPPYKVGDLWVQGPNGEVYRCVVSRSSGSFVFADWDKASKYTDDTAAINAQAAANLANSRIDNLGAMAYQNWVEKSRLGVTIIDGGYLRTDMVDAGRLVSIGIESQAGATTKANSALSQAVNYTDNHVVEAQQLGATVITGGHIATNLVDSDIIRSTVIRASYIEGQAFNFVQGSVGGFTLSGNSLTNSNGTQSCQLWNGSNPHLYMQNSGNSSETVIYAHGTDIDGWGVDYYNGLGGPFMYRATIRVTQVLDASRGNGGGGWAGLDSVNRKYAAIYASAYTYNANAATLEGHVYVGGTLTVNWNMRVIGMQGTWQTAESKVPVYWGLSTGELYHG